MEHDDIWMEWKNNDKVCNITSKEVAPTYEGVTPQYDDTVH